MLRAVTFRRILTVLMTVVAAMGRAESIVFPPDAGVVDVTRPPYSAKGDGKTDDTAAIQQALLDHGNTNRIIYLPDGTYLVSTTLRWPGGADDESRQRNTILQGQSRDGTVIRLADYSPGFSNSGRARPILWTGDSPGLRPRNAIRNLTVQTGVGNPGATGIRFFANREGGIRDVSIEAGGDGDGTVGLDLAHAEEIGPSFFKNIRISGFDLGVKAANPLYSLTLEEVELSRQRVAAIRNSGQVLNIRRMRSTNYVTAIQNFDTTGFVTVLDSTFQWVPGGRRQETSVQNRGALFARKVSVRGYTNFFENRAGKMTPPETPEITEFVSHEEFALFPSITNSLALPVEETPDIPWDPLPAWSGPHKFGGKAESGVDCSQALQQAIDSGAPTIYLPNGVWTLNQSVVLRGRARRIIGCEARLIINIAGGAPGFSIGDGEAPVVVIERLDVVGSNPLFDKATKRTVVVRDCAGVRGMCSGPGDLFLENVSSTGPWTFAEQRVFARQFHIAYEGTKILNTNSTVWIFGLTTELPGTLIRTVGGGKTELLGGLCASTGGWKSDPMFVVQESQATFQIAEASFSRAAYQTIVAETRNGKTLKLPNRGLNDDHRLPERLGGILLPFFTAQPQR